MATRVRMRTTYAGAAGTARGGEVIEVPDEEAAALIEGGYAEEIAAPAQDAQAATAAETAADDDRSSDRTDIETAEAEGAPETTAGRTRRPTPRRVGVRRPAAPAAPAAGEDE